MPGVFVGQSGVEEVYHMKYVNNLKEKIKNGQLNFGTHCSCTDLSFYEMCGQLGYDYVWIDNEHGGMTNPMVINAIIATNAGGCAAVVRVVDHSVGNIKPILEAGPDGIIFPLVNTAEDARRCIEVCKYPPMGIRGFGPRRAQMYGGIPDADFYAQANDSVLLIMQCERKESVDNLEEILAVPGVDGIICGLNDLSASVNKFGQINDPEVVDMVDQIITKCQKAGKPFGVSLGYNFELAKQWIDRGASFVSIGFPQDYYFMVGKDAVAKIRKIEDER